MADEAAFNLNLWSTDVSATAEANACSQGHDGNQALHATFDFPTANSTE